MRIDLYLDAEREWRKKEKLRSLKIAEQKRKELVCIAWRMVKENKLSSFDYIDICNANKQRIF